MSDNHLGAVREEEKRFCSCCGRPVQSHALTCGGAPGQPYYMENAEWYEPEFDALTGRRLRTGTNI